jgi:hypothetical protein
VYKDPHSTSPNQTNVSRTGVQIPEIWHIIDGHKNGFIRNAFFKEILWLLIVLIVCTILLILGL